MACYNYNRQEDKFNMLNSIIKSLNQIYTAPFRRVLFLSIFLSLLTTLLLWTLINKIIFNTTLTSITWLEWILDILGGGATFILLVFFLPTLVGLIASFMLESICRSVELVYYPSLPKVSCKSQRPDSVYRYVSRIALYRYHDCPEPDFLTIDSDTTCLSICQLGFKWLFTK